MVALNLSAENTFGVGNRRRLLRLNDLMANSYQQEPGLCRRCGAPLAGDELAGNCPRCLSALLFSSDSSDPFEFVPEPALRRIGDYELLEEVARGGMGIVYRARQVGMERFVAVKLLRDSLLAQPEDVKRFRAEAAAAGKLKHPNIVSIHEVGEEQGQHYLAMDLVSGPNLAQLTRAGSLEPRRAAELTPQIANAVQHAHSQGILHRDLKPSNVMVDSEGVPFVTDFGLARTMDTGSSLTLTGQLLGTPAYMSPEQAAGLSEAVGPAADVYSLGALLFHLLTNRPPFMSNSVPELLRQVAKDEPISPQLLNPSIPPELATICLKCLSKRPDHRYPSASELEKDLRRFLRLEPVLARPVSRAGKLWRWSRREPAAAAALTFAFFVLVAGGSSALWQWSRAEKEALTAKEQLWHAQLLEAGSYRLNGGFGQRTKDLDIVAKAAAYRPSLELRNEAIAALVLPDLGTNIWWRTEDNPVVPSAYTGNLEFFAAFIATGRVAVCQASNQQRLVQFDGPAIAAGSSQFSPDGRLLAIQFHDGSVRVWDWQAQQLKLEAKGPESGVGFPTFDFAPDSRELWLIGDQSKVERYALPGGQPLPLPPMSVSGKGLRLDRTGRRVLVFGNRTVSAWDVKAGECLGTWILPGEVWRVAWHPHGREFAVGTYSSGLFVGEVGQTNLDLLEAPDQKIVPTSLAFTPDGELVLAGGWGNLFAAWNFATRKVALWSQQLWFGQISDNGRRVSLLNEKRGYGVREFLKPIGVRRLRVPAALTGQVNSVAWHPSGSWFVMTHLGGWSIWDAAHCELLSFRQSGGTYTVQFPGDGTGFLTGGDNGPEWWPLAMVEGKPHVGEPRRLLPKDAGANQRAALSPDGTRFAATGTNGVFLGSLVGDSSPRHLPNSIADTVEFSPDGRWLRLGRMHEKVLHLHSAADGTLATNLPIGSPSMLFVPGRNELLAMGPSEFSFWQLGTWERKRALPFLDGTACQEFHGYWPSGSCVLANGKDMLLRLWDVDENREIACLRLAEGSASWACVFDPTASFMATTGNNPFLRVLDFPALRHELRAMGLDWPDAKPGKGFVGANGKLREL